MARTADQFEFHVKWLPFLLQPTTPKEGVDKRTYYLQKFGPRVLTMMANLKNIGREVGISFADDGTIGNTIDSHRLIEYAERHSKQDEVVEGIFKAYFEQGKNLGSTEVLTSIAKEAGLNEEQVRTYLQSDEGRDGVLAQDRQWKEEQIGGVPCFIFNDKVQLSGAQEPEVFERVFQSLKNEGARF